MKAKVLRTGKTINVKKNDELDACHWIDSETDEKYYDDEIEIYNDKELIQKYLESLTKDDCLSIIKYGLRGDERAPVGVTVEDIFEVIGCLYIGEVM